MASKPLLSIITPTLGKFSSHWLEQLLQIEGDVEFVLVYPPGGTPHQISDSRARTLLSPYKGEMMQRFIGLLNAKGTYLIALDDDDYAHPQIASLTQSYFSKFPDSTILRLSKGFIPVEDQVKIKAAWPPIPDLEKLDVNQEPLKSEDTELKEVPIAPLNAPFKLSYFISPFRKTGPHFENFNNIIWKTEIVQTAMAELSKATEFLGIITWIPRSGFDRLCGLFTQATIFRPETAIGHKIFDHEEHEQIRIRTRPALVKPARFHIVSDFLLLKYFPQYSYFWSLFLRQIYLFPRTVGKYYRQKWFMKKSTN